MLKNIGLGDEMQKVCVLIGSCGHIGLRFLWLIMHLNVSIWYFLLSLVNTLESFLISSGFLKSYRDLYINKVQYLSVVIDSEEAARTTNVLHLLRWLEAIGIEKVCLYETEGVLKKSKEALTLCLKSEKISKETTSDPLLEQKYEFGSHFFFRWETCSCQSSKFSSREA